MQTDSAGGSYLRFFNLGVVRTVFAARNSLCRFGEDRVRRIRPRWLLFGELGSKQVRKTE